MLMQVKKATFQTMGSGGKGRTENRWDVSGAGQSAPPEVYLVFPRYVQEEESAADRQSENKSVPGDIAVLCCKRDQYLVLLYTQQNVRL
jgi:hypothetical protein